MVHPFPKSATRQKKKTSKSTFNKRLEIKLSDGWTTITTTRALTKPTPSSRLHHVHSPSTKPREPEPAPSPLAKITTSDDDGEDVFSGHSLLSSPFSSSLLSAEDKWDLKRLMRDYMNAKRIWEESTCRKTLGSILSSITGTTSSSSSSSLSPTIADDDDNDALIGNDWSMTMSKTRMMNIRRKIDTCVCLGLGSLSSVNGAARWRSLFQLICLESILGMLNGIALLLWLQFAL